MTKITVKKGHARFGGKWRWRMTASNGEKIGNAGEGFATRRICLVNLYLVTGLNFIAPPDSRFRVPKHGGFERRFSYLGERVVGV